MKQKKKSWEPILAQPIHPNLCENGLDWLCYLAGNSQTAPSIFFKFSGYIFCYFIKNPQTTVALKFLTYIISAISGVFTVYFSKVLKWLMPTWIWSLQNIQCTKKFISDNKFSSVEKNGDLCGPNVFSI